MRLRTNPSSSHAVRQSLGPANGSRGPAADVTFTLCNYQPTTMLTSSNTVEIVSHPLTIFCAHFTNKNVLIGHMEKTDKG